MSNLLSLLLAVVVVVVVEVKFLVLIQKKTKLTKQW